MVLKPKVNLFKFRMLPIDEQESLAVFVEIVLIHSVTTYEIIVIFIMKILTSFLWKIETKLERL